MTAIEILRAASRSVPNEGYVQFMAAVDAVEALAKANRNLTQAVRAFADGEMSNELRTRLFRMGVMEPAREPFGDMCTANDVAEAALANVGGA